MKAIKHSIQINIHCIDGIQVWDHKRKNNDTSLRKLSKITAIVALSRNRNTESTGSSLPLQPTGSANSCQSQQDGSFRYKAAWDPDIENASSNTQTQEQSLLLETNLHPIRQTRSRSMSRSRSRQPLQQQQQHQQQHQHQQQQQQHQQHQHQQQHIYSPAFESKTFQVTIGLQRGDKFIVFAASAITIDGPVDDVQIKLPLSPVGMEDCLPKSLSQSQSQSQLQNAQGNWNIKPKHFKRDSARKFGLAKNAFIGATISIHNATCEYYYYYYYSIAKVERLICMGIVNCEPS